MGNQVKKDFILRFNLVLFLQLCSFNKIDVEATYCAKFHHQNGSIIRAPSEENIPRPKRPARLMPAQLLM